MHNLESSSELVRRAFRLAAFLRHERSVAIRIATEAMAKLEVAASTQHKRLYYRGQAGKAARTRVTLSDLHLLQRLVYVSSEPWELLEETSSPVNVDAPTMVIRYVKHLVRLTTRRNSFYVTLGIARVLCSYGTSETMDLYGLVIQDPDRVKDDYYYRSRKARLMSEMKQRFGSLLAIARGTRGEERFELEPDSVALRPLAMAALSAFTP